MTARVDRVGEALRMLPESAWRRWIVGMRMHDGNRIYRSFSGTVEEARAEGEKMRARREREFPHSVDCVWIRVKEDADDLRKSARSKQ